MADINTQYNFDTSKAPEGRPLLHYCTLSRFDFTWQSLMHSHAHAEIFCFTRGEGVLQVGEVNHSIRVGDMLVIPPHVVHTERSSLQNPLEYLVMGVGNVSFPGVAEKGGHHVLLRQEEPHGLLPYFEDMVREAADKQPGYVPVCLSILDIVLHKIKRLLPVDIGAVGQAASRECVAAKQLMDVHFQDNLTLDWLAKKTNISKYYLSRSFCRAYGLPPMHYLLKRRVQEAMYLLGTTTHSATEIAGMAGFSSVSYFSQAFKRIVGMSPSQYRQQERGEQEGEKL